jgi:hypothetical protein
MLNGLFMHGESAEKLARPCALGKCIE